MPHWIQIDIDLDEIDSRELIERLENEGYSVLSDNEAEEEKRRRVVETLCDPLRASGAPEWIIGGLQQWLFGTTNNDKSSLETDLKTARRLAGK